MTIQLSKQIEERLSAHVASGAFSSVEEVVQAALENFLINDEAPDDLKLALEEGIRGMDAGEGVSLEEFDRDMRARYGIPG